MPQLDHLKGISVISIPISLSSVLAGDVPGRHLQPAWRGRGHWLDKGGGGKKTKGLLLHGIHWPIGFKAKENLSQISDPMYYCVLRWMVNKYSGEFEL